MSQGNRVKRVETIVKQIISEMLIKELDIPKIARLSVTDVEMTTDLKIARVYFSVFGDEQDKTEIFSSLETHKKEIRYSLGKELDLRFVPELQFYRDESMEKAARIDALIKEIHKEDESE